MTRNEKLSTRVLVLIFAAVFIAAAVSAVILMRGDESTFVRVYLDGKQVHEVDLNAVTEPYEFTVTCEDGFNTIHVEHGSIRVISADCSDNTCVKQGRLTGGATPIICLPHLLVIQAEDAETETHDAPDFDAVAR